MSTSTNLLDAPPPEHLVHYTTLSGLLGIVSDKAIHASNVSYLNDKRELTHALEESLEVLTTVAKGADSLWRPALEAAEKRISDGELPPTYAACFCKEPDLLSQWRGYGGEQGVSIVFDRSRLEQAFVHTGAVLRRVFYTKVSTRQKVAELLEQQLRTLRDLDRMIDLEPRERADYAFRAISELLPRFKHRGFLEEAEWRFVSQEARENDVKYRVRGHALLPYIALAAIEAPLPILKVIVGPGREPAFTRKSVEHFLRAKGYTCPVVKSRVPYRT